ncbi:efflux transporter, outer membrane factor (OMF) lipoprotein, NodT family [Ferrimonas sediminum]|uniref:Efflux transporter, outer membrane factor (OMF) lipoprotein, NodT family n=1 Tax=Ferrimonas sediminum TaxID=718193 RepID=A0A1G9B422_9GAMM|nr:efflux transporter outer membrane subunit [Ferrimonas sediminum]SDK33760.1 efflux transporter, outer membrane factor (OMF) lipoprotein, NodT family [Ferrimonas sediminum]
MTHLRLYHPLLLALIVSGCALGPDYQRPQLDLPAQYHSDTDTGSDTHLGQQSWRQYYRDPNLQRLIEQALAQNLDLQTTASKLRAARSQVTVTDAALYPELSLSASGERSLDSGLTSTDPDIEDTLYLAGVVSWELDLWGANRRRSQASYANLLSSEQQMALATVSLISDVASRYYQWLDVEQRYRISASTVELRLKELDLARLRRANGVISGLEVRQAEVEYQSARVTLPQLDFERKQTANQLRILLGSFDQALQPGSKVTQPFQRLPDSLSVGVPSSMLTQRPDVQAAEQRLIAATANVGVAKTAFFPSFTISGSYGRESEQLGDILDSQGVTWSLLGGLTAPLFNAGRISAEYDIAKENAEQALLAYRSVVLTGYFEVNDAINGYRRSQLAIAAQEELVASSTEYVRLARLRYTNGVATSLDLLDAQRQLFSAQLALSQIKRDRMQSMVNLYRSLGGGAGSPPADQD